MTNVDDIEVWWKRIGCVRNPGIHTGEESAMGAEIGELRKALAERMNHLELLKKYMRVSVACSNANDFSSIAYDIGSDDSITEEETALLLELMDEVDDE